MKVVLIGVNHAGTSFLKFLKKKYPQVRVSAFDQNDNVSFLGCGIALWVGKEFDKPALFYATKENILELGVNLKMRHRVIAIDKLKKEVIIQNLRSPQKETFRESYDRLVVAIGSEPAGFIKCIPGINLKGIHVAKLFSDAKGIIKQLKEKKVKKVVIVGAGYIGIELTEAFYKLKKEVTLIDVENRIMPRYYDPEFTEILQNEMQEVINVKLGEKIISFVGDINNNVKRVVTDKNPSGYEADLVVMGVGFWPQTELVKDIVQLNQQKAIIVDEYFQTSEKDIYAIGDCIAIYDNARGRELNIALATNAIRSAFIASMNVGDVTGKLIKFPGVQGSNAISVFGWKLAATGLTQNSAKLENLNCESTFFEDKIRPEFMKKNEKIMLKVVWEKNTGIIRGAQVASKEDNTQLIYFFSLAILKQTKISELPLIDVPFLPHLNKPYNPITFLGLKALSLVKEAQKFTTLEGIKSENEKV